MLKEKTYIDKRTIHLGIIFILFLLNWVYNEHFFHNPRVLYSDELNGFLTLIENKSISLIEKIFGEEVIRPIPRLLYIICFQIGKKIGNYSFINYILLFGNFSISLLVYFVTYALVESNKYINRYIFGLITGTLYILSRFMSCQIFTILGIMEGLAHISVVFMFYIMANSLKNAKESYGKVLIFWLIAFLCHERYFLLFLAISFYILVSSWKTFKEKIKDLCMLYIICLIYFVLRLVLLGQNTFRGTASSNIKDTFSVVKFFRFILMQIAYILGISPQEQTRSGINFRDVPIGINILIGISILCILFLIINFGGMVYKRKEYEKLKIVLLAAVIISCCIISSSVTTVVALRFVYVSYSIWLIIIAYISSYIFARIKEKIGVLFLIIFCMYFVSTFGFENFYRTTLKNWGVMQEKRLNETLYDTTIGMYGKQLENASLLVVVMRPEATSDWYYQHFEPYIDTENLTINVVYSFLDAKQFLNISDVIIYEDTDRSCYIDISDIMHE